MTTDAVRRERLHNLLDLARTYRGWTRNQLAEALQRDPTKLYPDAGNPKLDFLMALADTLEWSVDAVIDYLWTGHPAVPAASETQGRDFATLNEEALTAYRNGQHPLMIRLARQMYGIAKTPEERAKACNREAGGWEGLGRAVKALEAIRRGLQQYPIPTHTRLVLQSNLANAYYTLWELPSARGTAQAIVEWYGENRPTDFRGRATEAFAYYVRGHTWRRMMTQEPEDRQRCAQKAKSDLETSLRLHKTLAEEFDHAVSGAIANTSRGALLEVEVELKLRSAQKAIDEFMDGLDPVIDPSKWPAGDWLESYGWWCVFGGNIALRHLKGQGLQHSMAIFTNKALEIANRLDNWALRERVYTLEYTLHQALGETSGLDMDLTIDDEDVRLIAGTMGRFPLFREIGWKIMQTAKVIKGGHRN